MDVFNIGRASGTHEFYSAIASLESRLSEINAFLTSDDLEMLSRLLPFRYVLVMNTKSTQQLCTVKDSPLSIGFSRAFSISHRANEIQYCSVQSIVALIYAQNHYSVVVIDVVERIAYHFDSHPTTVHWSAMTLFVQNLVREGILTTDELAFRQYFVQTRPQCGIFAFMIAYRLEHNFWKNAPIERRDKFLDALKSSASVDDAIKFRVELVNRVNYALIVLYNARSGLTQESPEQSGVLGELCNRAAMTNLVNQGMLSEVCMMEVTKTLTSSDIFTLHIIDTSMSYISDETNETIRKKSAVVILIRQSNLICYTTMIVRLKTNEFVLFLSEMIPSQCAQCIDALQRKFQPRIINIDPARVHYTMPAVLPILLWEWNNVMQRDCSFENLCDQLSSMPRLGVHAISTNNDIVYCNALAVALNSAYTRLTAATNAMDGTQTSIDIVRRALANACCDMRNRVFAQREIMRQEYTDTRTLENEIDSLIAFSKSHAPLRWRQTTNIHSIRCVYYKTLDDSYAPLKLIDMLAGVLKLARELFLSPNMQPILETLLHPLLEELHTTWPVMIFCHDEEICAVSPSVESDLYHSALVNLLSPPIDATEYVLFCPVALFTSDTSPSVLTFVKYIDIFEMQRLNTQGLLMKQNPSTLIADTRIDLKFLGGRASSTAVSSHEWCNDLYAERIAIPRFSSTLSTVPYVVSNATKNHTSAVNDGWTYTDLI